MKQAIIVAASAAMLALALALAGCAAPQDQQSNVEQKVGEAQQETAVQQSEPIKPSPDKYTWYVKDYRGMNAASVGYTALDELRHDRYGSGTVGIVYVSADGAYINPTDEESLKQYVVYDQNLKPNTEIKLEFLKQEDGSEYDNLVASESQEEIVLAVKKIGEADGTAPCMTAIDSSPDKYTRALRDYVGRNLVSCGYISMAGSLADHYGSGYITMNVLASDGSYIELDDKDSLADYLVVGQSMQPNTMITMEFSKKADGTEYDNLVSSQSVKSLDLKVAKLKS